MLRMRYNTKEKTHPCSSCDDIVPIDEMDNCGRCERCQDEYAFEEEFDED